MRKFGIGVNVHYIPIYKHPFYSSILPENFELPNSEDYYKKAITLPLHPTLTKADQLIVVQKLTEILS